MACVLAWRTCAEPGTSQKHQRPCGKRMGQTLQPGQAGSSSRPLPASCSGDWPLPQRKAASYLGYLLPMEGLLAFVFVAAPGKQIG